MRLSLVSLLLSCCLASAALAQTPASNYAANPKYVAAMAEAARLQKAHQYLFALDSYKKASKVAEGKSRPCLEHLHELQTALGQFKDALASAAQLQAIAENPMEKSIAEARTGQTLLLMAGDKPKPAQLEAAHAVLQAALTDYPKNNSARYSDACVLAHLGRMEDSSKSFATCADSAGPADPMRLRARHFADDPSLSLHKMAPAFEVTALDGSKFNLDSMSGRVVLVDFWATWCGPCNEELPNVKKMAKEFANEPLTIISISWDKDETAWRNFINKNEMTWLQYRDADHKLSERFNVNAIPHNFTIDSDGVLTAEVLGSGNDITGKIRKLLKKAHESHPAAVQASLGSR